ncbi:dynein axonemal heavy chain 1-like isoform X2 [Cotesia glomerata]|nr:dynein axonemal heavy chain 1-like isoform X2 [Cotesia glomerata]
MLDPLSSFLSLQPSLDAIFEVTLTTNSRIFSYAEEINEFVPSLLKWIDEIVVQLHAIKHPQAYLFPELKFPPNMFLSPIGLLDDVIVDAKTSIESFYRPLIGKLIAYVDSYQMYLEILSLDVESYLRDIEAENMDNHEIFQGLIHFKSELNCMNENLPTSVWIGVFKISIEAKKSLHDKYLTIIRGLITVLTNQCRIKVENIIAYYRDIELELTNTPRCIEEVIKAENSIREIPYVLAELRQAMDTVDSEYKLLEATNCEIPTSDFDLFYKAVGNSLKVTRQIKLTSKVLNDQRLKLLEDLQKDKLELDERIKSLPAKFEKVVGKISVENLHECAFEINQLWKLLNSCKSEALIVNQRQGLFDLPVTDFNHLAGLEKYLKPYKMLWTTAAGWLKTEEQWLENPIININSSIMQSFIKETEKNVLGCVELFENQPDILKITSYISTKIESFKPYTLIVDIITFPGLKERHREEIIMQTGISISQPPNLTLQQLLDLGIMTHMEMIAEVADKAQKEYSVEVTLEKLSQSWLNLKLEIAPHNSNSETCVISVSKELFEKLDEDIREVQQINCEAFEASANEWAAKLKLIRQVLSTWIDVQRMWINMEPVFSNEGISRQLPVEYKKFNTVQRYWRRIIKKARQNPNILHLCSDKSLLDILRECTGLMELVKKGLANNVDAVGPYVNRSLHNNIKSD